jgi:hypothetical protein
MLDLSDITSKFRIIATFITAVARTVHVLAINAKLEAK